MHEGYTGLFCTGQDLRRTRGALVELERTTRRGCRLIKKLEWEIRRVNERARRWKQIATVTGTDVSSLHRDPETRTVNCTSPTSTRLSLLARPCRGRCVKREGHHTICHGLTAPQIRCRSMRLAKHIQFASRRKETPMLIR